MSKYINLGKMIGHTGIITTPKTNFKALTYIIVINTSKAWYDDGEKDEVGGGGEKKQYVHMNSRNKSKLAFYKFFWHLTTRSTNNHIYFQFTLHI